VPAWGWGAVVGVGYVLTWSLQGEVYMPGFGNDEPT